MKLLIAVALCVVGVALGTTVCVPTPNWVQVQLWDGGNQHNPMPGYVSQLQFLDITNQLYRQTDIEFVEHHGNDRTWGQDMIVDAKQQKVYIIEGVPQDPSTWHCRVTPQAGSLKDPCLTYNATKISTDLIGSEKVDNYYTEDSHHGVKVYGRLLFTQTGIPVSFVTWNQYGHQEQLFLDFNQTLPTNAFSIPSICNNAKPVTMTASELVKQFKLGDKWQPAH
jgi:hypothetical protein